MLQQRYVINSLEWSLLETWNWSSEFVEKLELDLRQDLLLEKHGRWLKCVILPSGMNHGIFTCSILFSNEWDIQVGSWPNTIVKGTRKSEKSSAHVGSGIGTGVSIQNSCTHSNRMNVSVQEQSVTTEWMCMFGKQMCLFRKVAPVPTKRMCLFGRIAPIITERFSLNPI